MAKIIGVRFKQTGKMYYFDPLDYDIKRGMHVIVETSRGVEYGEVTLGIREAGENEVVKPLKGVLRIATDEDTARHKEAKNKEREAFSVCAAKIREHGLEMKLIEVEYAFDGSKLLFYFTADGRVDFRELVKDLATVFRTRIELRQIGVRDESKTMGSIGMCGRNLCCSEFLGNFVPVSIKMAKEQGLSLNPSKISGACGRLMCCLKYEQDTYEALMADFPKQGAVIETPSGKGTVVSVALMRGKVKVKLEDENETTLKEFDISELNDGKNAELPELLDSSDKAEAGNKRTRKPRRLRKLKKQLENTEKSAAPSAPEKSAQEEERSQEEKKKSRRHASRHGGRRRNNDPEQKTNKRENKEG